LPLMQQPPFRQLADYSGPTLCSKSKGPE